MMTIMYATLTFNEVTVSAGKTKNRFEPSGSIFQSFFFCFRMLFLRWEVFFGLILVPISIAISGERQALI